MSFCMAHAASSSPNERRNYRLGILHHALAELGKTLSDPSLVLALLVRQLGGSNTLVGLLSTIRYGGFFLPQLFVARLIQNEPRKSPYYVKAELTRSAGYAVIALAILALPQARLLLPIFFILFAVSYLAHGTGSVPNFDSKILSNLFWDHLSRRRESRVILQLSAAAALAIPVSALLIGLLPGRSLPGYPFMLVFMLMGVRDSGKHIGKRSVLLDTVPVAELPTYWGLLNTVLGIVSLLPVLAGQMIDWLGLGWFIWPEK